MYIFSKITKEEEGGEVSMDLNGLDAQPVPTEQRQIVAL